MTNMTNIPAGREKSQEYAGSDEARTDTEAHVNDQPIPSTDDAGVGEPAGTEAGKSPHRTHLYNLLIHHSSPSTALRHGGLKLIDRTVGLFLLAASLL